MEPSEKKTDARANILQMIKFTLFSISAGIIQVISFWLFNDVLCLGSYWTTYIPSLVLSVVWNFTFNRRYTFKSSANLPRSMFLVALYYVIFTPASAWWGTALQNIGWHDWVIEIGNMLINFVTEFLYQRFVVYRNSINTNDIAEKNSK